MMGMVAVGVLSIVLQAAPAIQQLGRNLTSPKQKFKIDVDTTGEMSVLVNQAKYNAALARKRAERSLNDAGS